MKGMIIFLVFETQRLKIYFKMWESSSYLIVLKFHFRQLENLKLKTKLNQSKINEAMDMHLDTML